MFQTLSKRGIRQAESISPPCQWHRFVAICQQSICSTVSLLFALRCPAHIPRLVVAVVVEAINRVFFRRRRTDVVQKGNKRSLPFIANANPLRAVITVAWTTLTRTPISHRNPTAIFTRTIVRTPVCAYASAREFALQATTRLRIAITQRTTSECFRDSAIAFAQPAIITRDGFPVRPEGQQASKPMPSQIDAMVGHVSYKYIQICGVGL